MPEIASRNAAVKLGHHACPFAMKILMPVVRVEDTPSTALCIIGGTGCKSVVRRESLAMAVLIHMPTQPFLGDVPVVSRREHDPYQTRALSACHEICELI